MANLSQRPGLKMLTFRLPSSESDLLDDYCAQQGSSKTQVVREAILVRIAGEKASPLELQKQMGLLQQQVLDLTKMLQQQAELVVRMGAASVLSSALLRDDFSGPSENSEQLLERHLLDTYKLVPISLKARQLVAKELAAQSSAGRLRTAE